MSPTRRRTRLKGKRTKKDEYVLPDNVVIKTEVIDEGYEVASNYSNFSLTVKSENLDPEDVIVKQEPLDFDFSNVQIKAEPSEDEQDPSNKEERLQTRSSAKRAVLTDSSVSANTKRSRNGLSSNSNQSKQLRSKKQISSKPDDKEKPKKSKDKTSGTEKQNGLNNTELEGCILHMNNILEASKTLNNNENTKKNNKNNNNNDNVSNNNITNNSSTTMSEEKRLRLRVKSLLPKDQRYPIGHYKCYSCDIDFNRLAEWEDHLMLYFQQKGCFPSSWTLLPTTQKYKGGWTATDRKTFLCNSCSFETKHKQDVYQHIVAKHEPQCHKCAVCAKTFNTLHYLKNHLSYKHDSTRTTLNCSYCNYKTIDKYSLNTHVRTKHTKEGFFMCDQCDVKMPTKYKMKLHKRKAHSAGLYNKELIKCTHCSYVTNEMKRLREHFKRLHMDEEVYSCAYCNYKGGKHYLEVHIFKMHMKDKVEKKFKCDICDKMFPSEAGLLSHNRIMHVSGPETIACKYCQQIFLTKHDCFIHTNLQHLSKPEFNCNECSYLGIDKDALREHIFKKHRFKFHCAHCSFTTHAKIYIYIHINSRHNPNGRKFKCPKCQYAAKNKTLLKQHVNVKHNPNAVVYTCFHCGHQNKIKHKLSQHMQNKHLKEFKKKKNKKNEGSAKENSSP